MDSDESDAPSACPTCGGDVSDDSVHYEWRCLDCGTVCHETADAGTGPWGGPTTAHRIEPGERPTDTEPLRWYHVLGIGVSVLVVGATLVVSMIALSVTLNSGGTIAEGADIENTEVEVVSPVDLTATLVTEPFMWVGMVFVAVLIAPVVWDRFRRLQEMRTDG